MIVAIRKAAKKNKNAIALSNLTNNTYYGHKNVINIIYYVNITMLYQKIKAYKEAVG